MLEKPEKVAAERVAATLVVAEKTARSQAGTSPAATTFRTFGIPYSTEEGIHHLFLHSQRRTHHFLSCLKHISKVHLLLLAYYPQHQKVYLNLSSILHHHALVMPNQ